MTGEQVVVIGLGRFGSAVARELERLGHQVLAIDRSEQLVNEMAPDVTHALQLDAADEDALRSVGAADFNTAIVAISSDAEPSIFATMVLKRLGVRNVVAKAGSVLHGEILARVGADRVVFPELDAGVRLAHSLGVRHINDYISLSPSTGIAKLQTPANLVGHPLVDVIGNLGSKLNVLLIKRGSSLITVPHYQEVLQANDELIIVGADAHIEAFCEQNPDVVRSTRAASSVA